MAEKGKRKASGKDGLLRKLSPEELQHVLDAHREWLTSGKENGQRANLGHTDLQGADLSGVDLREAELVSADLSETHLRGAKLQQANLARANLQGAIVGGANFGDANLCEANLQEAHLGNANFENADLGGANLSEAHLGGADFRRSKLTTANLQGAKLLKARLWEADLQDANLEGVRSFLGSQLAGANVAGAKLPEAIAQFDGLHRVEVTAGIARPMFIMLILFCIYAFATIASTTDAALLADSPSALLPDVNVPIPTAGFYFAAPILLFALYLYFHLHLEQLFNDIADLPSVFPDGTPVHRNIYPWLLLRLLAQFAARRKAIFRRDISVVRSIIEFVFVIVVWWLAPFTLLLFWGKYLPAHEWSGTGLHIVLLVVAIGYGGFGLFTWGLGRVVPRGTLSTDRVLKRRQAFRNGTALAILLILFGLSYGSLNGTPRDKAPLADPRTWASRILAFVGHRSFAMLRDFEISKRPADWRSNDALDLIKGADLSQRNMRYADAVRAFLAKSDLTGSNLFGANLTEADLRYAILVKANLQEAVLVAARLENAVLSGANLSGAILTRANMLEANLGKAKLRSAVLIAVNLQGANIKGADLQHADLQRAELQMADLSGADLQEANLRGAKLQGAVLANADLRRADLSDTDLKKTNLRVAKLRGANLQAARLTGANLVGAHLQGAILRKADLRGAAIRKAHLQGTILRFAKLQNAELGGAELREADLGGAYLNGADLKSAGLQDVNLSGADLEGATLENATLEGASLSGAKLKDTLLVGADLGGADFYLADIQGLVNFSDADLSTAKNLTQVQLDGACGNNATRLPTGLAISRC
jgi:uncharacterized protein YjbI with pentapeptide repeats